MENLLQLILFAISILIVFLDIFLYCMLYKNLTINKRILGIIPFYIFWILYKKNTDINK